MAFFFSNFVSRNVVAGDPVTRHTRRRISDVFVAFIYFTLMHVTVSRMYLFEIFQHSDH